MYLTGISTRSLAMLSKRLYNVPLNSNRIFKEIKFQKFCTNLCAHYSLKHENIYLENYNTVKEAKEGIRDYIDFYNNKRPHESLNYKTQLKRLHSWS